MKNLNIIIMAVKIRLRRGEELETILSRYLNLSEADKQKIREAVK